MPSQYAETIRLMGEFLRSPAKVKLLTEDERERLKAEYDKGLRMLSSYCADIDDLEVKRVQACLTAYKGMYWERATDHFINVMTKRGFRLKMISR